MEGKELENAAPADSQQMLTNPSSIIQATSFQTGSRLSSYSDKHNTTPAEGESRTIPGRQSRLTSGLRRAASKLRKSRSPPQRDETLADSEAPSVPTNLRQTEASDPPPREKVAVIFPTEDQTFILVKPSFAAGFFGCCSLWQGLNDGKLYVRKIQNEQQVPKDFTHYIAHPNVVKLILACDHGPCNAEVGDHDENCLCTHKYSILTEFVNGQTLEDVTTDYKNRRQAIPESSIWHMALTMLICVRHFLYRPGDDPRGPLFHNDMHSRNVIVTNDAGEEKFHLIDFGIAELASERAHGVFTQDKQDTLAIGASVQEMMGIDRYMAPGLHRATMLSRYSIELVDIMEEFYQTPPGPDGYMYKETLDDWIERCHKMRSIALQSARENLQPTKLVVSRTECSPMLFETDEQGEVRLRQVTRGRSAACIPFQVALVDEETLDVIRVGVEFSVSERHFA